MLAFALLLKATLQKVLVRWQSLFARPRIQWIRASKRHHYDASKEVGNSFENLAHKSKISNEICHYLPIPALAGPLKGLALAKPAPDWGIKGIAVVVLGP